MFAQQQSFKSHDDMTQDDMVVSPHYFPWLTRALCDYGNQTSLGGISLQRSVVRQVFSEVHAQAHLVVVNAENIGAPFLYPGAGSWGFSPMQEHWSQFLKWHSSAQCKQYEYEQVQDAKKHQHLLETRLTDAAQKRCLDADNTGYAGCSLSFPCDPRLGSMHTNTSTNAPQTLQMPDLLSSHWFSSALETPSGRRLEHGLNMA